MNSENHSDIGQIDVGNTVIDGDHHALAQLVEKVANVCEYSLSPVCACDKCPKKKPRDCCHELAEICHEMMARMLEHFHHEDELMNALPRTQATKELCLAHRLEHVNFSTRYNLATSSISVHHPILGLKALDDFFTDWVRTHVLEYDQMLAALLRAKPSSQ